MLQVVSKVYVQQNNSHLHPNTGGSPPENTKKKEIAAKIQDQISEG